MRIKDIDVFVPNKGEDTVVDFDPVNKVFFTLIGQHDYMYDGKPAINSINNEYAKEVCAKKIGSRYYIRTNHIGELYNPLDTTHTKNAEKKTNNLPVWKYINVAYTCFANYVHFLKTRNSLYLTLARRDIGSST